MQARRGKSKADQPLEAATTREPPVPVEHLHRSKARGSPRESSTLAGRAWQRTALPTSACWQKTGAQENDRPIPMDCRTRNCTALQHDPSGGALDFALMSERVTRTLFRSALRLLNELKNRP